jgi:hypothetical protein
MGHRGSYCHVHFLRDRLGRRKRGRAPRRWRQKLPLRAYRLAWSFLQTQGAGPQVWPLPASPGSSPPPLQSPAPLPAGTAALRPPPSSGAAVLRLPALLPTLRCAVWVFLLHHGSVFFSGILNRGALVEAIRVQRARISGGLKLADTRDWDDFNGEALINTQYRGGFPPRSSLHGPFAPHRG